MAAYPAKTLFSVLAHSRLIDQVVRSYPLSDVTGGFLMLTMIAANIAVIDNSGMRNDRNSGIIIISCVECV